MYERYAAIRDGKGETDYSVSKGSGVSSATISCWKRGEYTPKVDKLIKIAKYLEVSLEEIIGECE